MAPSIFSFIGFNAPTVFTTAALMAAALAYFSRTRIYVSNLQKTLAHVATLPVTKVSKLENWVYCHGGFMGAAVEVLRDPGWARMVETLTPHTFTRVLVADAACQHTISSGTLMSIMENNPVLAAFGVAHSSRRSYPKHAHSIAHNRLVIEWDVYPKTSDSHEIEEELRKGCSLERRKDLALHVVNSTVVAHGSLAHTFCERLLGMSMHSSIMKQSGDMTIPRWLDAYQKAMKTVAADVEVSAVSDALLHVFLDVKSTRASPALLQLLVEGINHLGVAVWGVGSFVFAQLKIPTVVAPTQFAPPLRIYLFSNISSVQSAYQSGELPHGAAVLFNGGSLIAYNSVPDASAADIQASYHIPDYIVSELANFKLQLGFYVQEPNIDSVAIELLNGIVSSHRDVFPLGFNYSNLLYTAAADVSPTPSHVTNGFVIPWWLRPFFYRPWKR
jgi:hypothetical protein